jgi:hypothetical protein
MNGSRALTVAWLLLPAAALAAGPAPAPPVGAWATYQWTSAIRQEVPVIVRQEGPGGQATWSVSRESTAPAPLYVTYAIVRGDSRTYTLQIVTRQTPEGPALSVTHVRVDRASGKALRSVTRRPKGVIPTPENELRPFRPADVQGAQEPVAVPAGRFTTIRAPWRDGTVWVSDQAPVLGLVKAAFPSGTLELVGGGATGARDLLRS